MIWIIALNAAFLSEFYLAHLKCVSEPEDKLVVVVDKLGGMALRGKDSDGRSDVWVFLDSTKVGDSDLLDITPLMPDATMLVLGSNITDAGLKNLSTLKMLAHLDVRDSRVTDEGLKEIAKLKTLTHLDLNNAFMTDEGLKSIAKLPHLTTLTVFGPKVTKDTADQLRKLLPKCQIHVCKKPDGR